MAASRMINGGATSHILQSLRTQGYAHVPANLYYQHSSANYLRQLQSSYQFLPKDNFSEGSRYRAYSRFGWCSQRQVPVQAASNDYSQSPEYNNLDGGKIRQFAKIHSDFLNNPIVKYVLGKNIEIARADDEVVFDASLVIGLHQIRYHADQGQASYSSPTWLHKDDEPLVFVHMMNLSKNVIGGDNVLAANARQINKVLRLTQPFETLALHKKELHAVTPIGSADHLPAHRDILLVTFHNQQPVDYKGLFAGKRRPSPAKATQEPLEQQTPTLALK